MTGTAPLSLEERLSLGAALMLSGRWQPQIYDPFVGVGGQLLTIIGRTEDGVRPPCWLVQNPPGILYGRIPVQDDGGMGEYLDGALVRGAVPDVAAPEMLGRLLLVARQVWEDPSLHLVPFSANNRMEWKVSSIRYRIEGISGHHEQVALVRTLILSCTI